MAEATIYTFSITGYVGLCVKHLGLREGLWGPYFEFGFSVENVPVAPDSKTCAPGAINVINKLGIQRFDSETSFTVDAAVVNPASVSQPDSDSLLSALEDFARELPHT